MQHFLPFFLYSFTVIFSSCNLINPPEKIPAYLKIDSVSFESSDTTGSSSHKIIDAWVYVNNNPLGSYEFPATFPVLVEGINKIKFYAGIADNGLKSIRVIYPFYLPYETTFDFIPRNISTVNNITFQYNPITTFAFIEDFENVGTKFENFGGDTTLIRTTDMSEVFEGNASGKIVLTPTHPNFLSTTFSKYKLPVNTQPVYLELNYKNDFPFDIGIMTLSGSEVLFVYKLTITPKETWNKIYVNLTPEVNELRGTEYQILLRSKLDGNTSQATILLDNIKLLY